MKYVKISDLKPDMILANSLYDNNENILLRANARLTTYHINRIEKFNYDGLYIFEDNEIYNHNTIISEGTRLKALKSLKHLNIDDCLYIANQLVEEVRSNPTIIVEMINLSSYDNYTYNHSINVDILSVVLGIGLGLKDKELVKLSQAALLHDIGKTGISKKILNKPKKLSPKEYKEVQNHSYYGYNMLKNNDNIASVVRNAIYSHHENEDGSGYPRGLVSKKIHKFAKIIHIADVYDALTARRVYKEPLNPADTLEYLMANAGTMFDIKMVETFMKYVAPYHVGTTVQLSNGQTATVLKNNPNQLGRPIVQTEDKVIDLMEVLDITITGLLTI